MKTEGFKKNSSRLVTRPAQTLCSSPRPLPGRAMRTWLLRSGQQHRLAEAQPCVPGTEVRHGDTHLPLHSPHPSASEAWTCVRVGREEGVWFGDGSGGAATLQRSPSSPPSVLQEALRPHGGKFFLSGLLKTSGRVLGVRASSTGCPPPAFRSAGALGVTGGGEGFEGQEGRRGGGGQGMGWGLGLLEALAGRAQEGALG